MTNDAFFCIDAPVRIYQEFQSLQIAEYFYDKGAP